MTPDAVILLTIIALIWIGWPLHSIASDLRFMRRKIKD